MLYKKLKRLSLSLEEADKIALRLRDIIEKEASCLGMDILCCYHSHYKIPVYSVYTSRYTSIHLVHGAGINITICIKKGKFELFEDKNIGEDRDKALDLLNRLNLM